MIDVNELNQNRESLPAELISCPTITPWDLYVSGCVSRMYFTAEDAVKRANELIKLRPKTPEELGL